MADGTNINFWQRMAKLYAPFMRSAAPLYDAVCGRCRPYLSQKMDVLELACGSGQLTFRLAEGVRWWEATDFSEKMLAEAMKHPGPQNLTFAVQDATNLPYSDASFDAALIANALHVMPSPERALAEIRRVLRPGGLLLAPTFIWGTDIRQRISTRLMALAGFHVFHKWSTGEFVAYVEKQGFAVLGREMLGGGIRPLCCLIARKV